MKRKLALLPVLLLLGCSRITKETAVRLEEKLAEASASEIRYTNYGKEYYSYYIQPYVGRAEADAVSNTFVLDGRKFVMNLNISSVINEYDHNELLLSEDYLSESSLIASSEGMYTDAEGNEYPYRVKICRLENSCIVILHSAYFDFCGFCSEAEAPDTAAEMLRIARGAKVNREEILAEYTYDKAISYTGKAVKLFEDISPENGSIEELFIDSNTSGTGIGEYTDDSQEYHEQIETDEAPEETEEEEESEES